MNKTYYKVMVYLPEEGTLNSWTFFRKYTTGKQARRGRDCGYLVAFDSLENAKDFLLRHGSILHFRGGNYRIYAVLGKEQFPPENLPILWKKRPSFDRPIVFTGEPPKGTCYFNSLYITTQYCAVSCTISEISNGWVVAKDITLTEEGEQS